MKRTDYDVIAPRYDQNRYRLLIPRDEFLAERVAAASQRPFAVLDVACGTGNYLVEQRRQFADAGLRFSGLDASAAMLALARPKLDAVTLVQGRVESMPFEAASYDYVNTNFAFHHFEDKPRALDEMARVLRPGGALRIHNIEPYAMQSWWLYEWFPEARAADRARFWPVLHLDEELERRGFDATLRVVYTRSRASLSEVLEHVERRDISSLAILSDDEYARGLALVKNAHARHPDAQLRAEIAFLTCTAIAAG